MFSDILVRLNYLVSSRVDFNWQLYYSLRTTEIKKKFPTVLHLNYFFYSCNMQDKLHRKTFAYRYQNDDIFFCYAKKEVYDVRGNRTKETAQAKHFFEAKMKKKKKSFLFWVNSKEVGRETNFNWRFLKVSAWKNYGF